MPGSIPQCPSDVPDRERRAQAVINAFLMIAAAGVGFGGYPWVAFAISAVLVVAFGLPDQVQSLKRYKGQPKADLVLAIVFKAALAVAGALASAWGGYGLRYLLAHVLRT